MKMVLPLRKDVFAKLEIASDEILHLPLLNCFSSGSERIFIHLCP
jgi:hypothetical protein